MGGGTYSVASATSTRALGDFANKSNEEIFTNQKLASEMSPFDVTVREARDSDEHPNSLAIIIGLDVTGSMGSVPQMLVRDGLPSIMDKIIQSGELDPQLLFLGIGDHECDQAPLQVGQFESNDVALDHWLTSTYLEGGGGGNSGESYLLAWYFAAMHTSIDCHEKRGRKGILITIGDEPTLRSLPARRLQAIMGPGQHTDYSAQQLLELASERYDVFHIHLLSTGAGHAYKDEGSWQQLLGDNLIMAQSPEIVADTIASLVADHAHEAHTNGPGTGPVETDPTSPDAPPTEEEAEDDVVL